MDTAPRRDTAPRGRSRRRWWLAAPLAVGAAAAATVALVGGPGTSDSERTPASGSSPSGTATRPPITVQPDLPELGESQFGDGPVQVEPTQPPATDVGGPVGGATPAPSPSAS